MPSREPQRQSQSVFGSGFCSFPATGTGLCVRLRPPPGAPSLLGVALTRGASRPRVLTRPLQRARAQPRPPRGVSPESLSPGTGAGRGPRPSCSRGCLPCPARPPSQTSSRLRKPDRRALGLPGQESAGSSRNLSPCPVPAAAPSAGWEGRREARPWSAWAPG